MTGQPQRNEARRRTALRSRASVARDTILLSLLAVLLIALFGDRGTHGSSRHDTVFGFALSVRAPALKLHLEFSL
jgi:hypothetical protein